jgi:hypothetical protein
VGGVKRLLQGVLSSQVWKSSQGFSLYNIERNNPFEERLLVCKVAKRVVVYFQVNGRCGRDFLENVGSFSGVKKLVLQRF